MSFNPLARLRPLAVLSSTHRQCAATLPKPIQNPDQTVRDEAAAPYKIRWDEGLGGGVRLAGGTCAGGRNASGGVGAGSAAVGADGVRPGLLSGCWKGELLMSSINQLEQPASGSVKPLDLTFIVANVVGIAFYLRLASRSWRIPEEHGAVPVSGEPFVWALALPVLGVFLLADLVWGGLLIRRREQKRWLWWFIAAGLWLIALCVDFIHH